MVNIYLVGGAVRDQLLNRPIGERDWVVVGATPEDLLRQGYQQVGRHFPVFLHPETKEEYALARVEHKLGPGYYGFNCDYHQAVTLEEDLRRRDLTINAMAQDEQGQLIDPYGGQADLQAKILRHVSPAFTEDPVRVLRIARFLARYQYLGFKIAAETYALMHRMVLQGELDHLIPERVWQEWQGSFKEKNPEAFIKALRACGALKIIIPELDCLFGVPNPKKYHPEIDSGLHSLMALQAATQRSSDLKVRFAALLHDLGKGLTPMLHWPKHYGHEERGVGVIDALCQRLRVPAEYRKVAVLVARWHLTIHRIFELRPKTIVKLFEKTDAFRNPQRFEQLLLACQADAEGCGLCRLDYPQKAAWEHLLAVVAQQTLHPVDHKNLPGELIKQQLHEQRVRCVTTVLNTWEFHEKQ